MKMPDPEQIIEELHGFQGGVADTCTLIYLKRINMLAKTARSFQLLVPADVMHELGCLPPGCIICAVKSAENTDRAVIQLALDRQVAVLSEDRKLLMACRWQGLHYYNSLMILLALLLQQKLSLGEYKKGYALLRGIARYSSEVWHVGDQVFSLYVR